MKNFHKLSDQELKEIKGGKRFLTKSWNAFLSKKFKLMRDGIEIKGEEIDMDNKHYCIEW